MTSPRLAKMLECLLGAPASRRHSDLRSLPKASGTLACPGCARKAALVGKPINSYIEANVDAGTALMDAQQTESGDIFVHFNIAIRF